MSAIRRALRAALGLTVPATVVVAGLAVFEHARAGVREIGEPPLALHVARDVGLALVVGLVAVTAVLYRLRNRATAARSIAGAATAGLAMAAGVFGHDLVFPAAGHGASGLNHDIREATGAAVLGALVALACGARAWLPMLQRRARRAAVVALALSMTMVGASALTGATIAGADREPAPDLKSSGGEQFNNPALDEGDLADKVEPCVKDSPLGAPFTAAMPIPPAVQVVSSATSDSFDVTERATTAEIIPGIQTPVWGYNGMFPGPTIMARKGRVALVTFHNRLPTGDDAKNIEIDPPLDQREHPFIPSSTVVHLHGINDEPVSDGYPTIRRVPPGQPPSPEHPAGSASDQTHHYDNDEFQTPATLWYHDHSLHITSEHIYRGLAGFYILKDDAEDALPLPKGYGVKDIPLLLKDVMIDPANGKLNYNNCSHHGAYGDVMTVNGKQQPHFDVANTKYRFRSLDGSDARQYEVALRPADRLSDPAADQPFVILGSDQGLLAAPEPVTEFHITPSERVEFGVDFSKYPVGTRLVMVNELVDPQEPWFPLMAFDVTRTEADNSQFVGRPQQPLQPPAKTVHFTFDRQGGDFSINSRQFDENRFDDKPIVNTAENWVIENKSGGWGHPIHIHLGRFKVLDINGRPPLPGEDGWKDTVWLGPNDTITVRPEFANFTGRYVFHCHNGSHEDHDMMSNFQVQPS